MSLLGSAGTLSSSSRLDLRIFSEVDLARSPSHLRFGFQIGWTLGKVSMGGPINFFIFNDLIYKYGSRNRAETLYPLASAARKEKPSFKFTSLLRSSCSEIHVGFPVEGFFYFLNFNI